jgi:predicted DCC family thiol-disulfide oxidoreductase YuxK
MNVFNCKQKNCCGILYYNTKCWICRFYKNIFGFLNLKKRIKFEDISSFNGTQEEPVFVRKWNDKVNTYYGDEAVVNVFSELLGIEKMPKYFSKFIKTCYNFLTYYLMIASNLYFCLIKKNG